MQQAILTPPQPKSPNYHLFPYITPLNHIISLPPHDLNFSAPIISSPPPPGTTTCSAASTQNTKMGSAAHNPRCEYEPHFLDSCFLCHRSLSQNHDIFMYRGNTPFCSQECRQEQIGIDEAAEKRLKLSSSKRSKSVRQINSESAKDSDTNKAMRTGTVAVA